MRIYVGVTDFEWFTLLKSRHPNEVNFWQPNSARNFRAVQEGELFLLTAGGSSLKGESPVNTALKELQSIRVWSGWMFWAFILVEWT